MALQQERNQEATVWIGGLDENVDEDLLWELMIQAGPVKSVNIPRDKITREHSGYAFVEFKSEEDADYAMKIMNMVRLYGKALKINKASRDNKETGVGANIFVGNLDPDVDDQLLYRTFSTFGQVLSAKVMYEDDGSSRGFGFVNFADFDSADTAISNMNGQFLSNRPIHVSYAYKKEGMAGERHGSENERLLAVAQNQKMPPKHDNFNTSGFAMQKQLDSLKKTDTTTSDTNTNNNTTQNTNTTTSTSNTNIMRPPPVPPRSYYPPMYYPPPIPNSTGQQWRPPPVPFGYPPMNPFMPPPYPMMRPPPFPNMMPPPIPNKSTNAPPPPPKKT